jgi:hypothetical protein
VHDCSDISGGDSVFGKVHGENHPRMFGYH